MWGKMHVGPQTRRVCVLAFRTFRGLMFVGVVLEGRGLVFLLGCISPKT